MNNNLTFITMWNVQLKLPHLIRISESYQYIRTIFSEYTGLRLNSMRQFFLIVLKFYDLLMIESVVEYIFAWWVIQLQSLSSYK